MLDTRFYVFFLAACACCAWTYYYVWFLLTDSPLLASHEGWRRSHAPHPPCCAWDEAERALNDPRYCNASGWNPEAYAGLPHSLAYSGGHSCACTTSQNLTFHSQHLPAWNAARFCALLGGRRRIMLVGDSTMQQTASALMSLLAFTGGGCQTQILFGLSDTLVGRAFGLGNRGQRWTEWARRLAPGDVLVLSAGPHLMLPAAFEAVLDEVLREHNASFGHLRLAWRSQFPGGCGPGVSDAYNYRHYRGWDRRARARAPAFIDLTPLYARHDAHVGSAPHSPYPSDCQHFCHSVLYDLVGRVFLRFMER